MARAKATTGDKPVKARKGSKTTLSEANLAALGVERLASILMDLSVDAYVKRALKLELLAEAGGGSLALEISKRFAAICKATSRIHWRKYGAFARELDLHRTMIERLAVADAKTALGLMLDLLEMAAPVLDRISQPEGVIGDVFIAASLSVGEIALRAQAEPEALADRLSKLIVSDDGLFDDLIEALAPALGSVGLERLRQSLEAALAPRTLRNNGAYDVRAALLRQALRQIADLSGDVNAYIATFPKALLKTPLVAAEVGRRLLALHHAKEALAVLEAASPGKAQHARDGDDPVERSAWEEVYLDALQANGRRDEAQTLRWAAFEATLSVRRLRAFLKELPDFDDVIAEDRAKQVAEAFPQVHAALAFFIEWPDLAAASRLILNRHGALNGANEDLLTAAARRLEGAYPLAASLLLRALVQHTLTYGVAYRYKAAAKHLLELESLVPMIADFGDAQDHQAFMNALRAAHGRKHGFRAELESLGGSL